MLVLIEEVTLDETALVHVSRQLPVAVFVITCESPAGLQQNFCTVYVSSCKFAFNGVVVKVS